MAAWGDEIDPHIGPTNPSVDVPPDVLGDVQDTLSWWQSELRSGTSDRHAHSNLLILSNLETDWGTWWGWADGDDAAVVTGAEQIAAMPTGRQSSPGTAPAVFTNMAIHEVGHNLGLSHGLGERVEVDGEVLNTPMATGSGDPWHDGFLHRFSGQSVLVGPWG